MSFYLAKIHYNLMSSSHIMTRIANSGIIKSNKQNISKWGEHVREWIVKKIFRFDKHHRNYKATICNTMTISSYKKLWLFYYNWSWFNPYCGRLVFTSLINQIDGWIQEDLLTLGYGLPATLGVRIAPPNKIVNWYHRWGFLYFEYARNVYSNSTRITQLKIIFLN
jgi:hypothetical protein